MQKKEIIKYIVGWLNDYSAASFTEGFIIGISGGIDSALTSALCAMTGKRVMVLNMPIRQHQAEFDRGNEHIAWLKQHYPNVLSAEVKLTPAFEQLEQAFDAEVSHNFLAMANTRARLRMLTLYAYAGRHKLLVAGTGNKIEDFGIGFFTKYGDGGVDISPIAGLMKSQVYSLAAEAGVVTSILQARPTDGLFADNRTDEDQIGASYDELEWAMRHIESGAADASLDARQKHVLEIYKGRHKANLHKMEPIPVCKIPKELLD